MVRYKFDNRIQLVYIPLIFQQKQFYIRPKFDENLYNIS